jgi:hypothetical protein
VAPELAGGGCKPQVTYVPLPGRRPRAEQVPPAPPAAVTATPMAQWITSDLAVFGRGNPDWRLSRFPAPELAGDFGWVPGGGRGHLPAVPDLGVSTNPGNQRNADGSF